MKKTMTYVVAAAAVAMALVSCSKDKLIEKGTRNEQTLGVRTLTVSFANGTKTYVTDGSTQPLWSENDQILLADGTATETYTVTAAQAGTSSFQITTALTGPIKAVYPASAAILEGNTINGVDVPATQNGTFGSANICMAEESAGKLSFQNQTAVVEVKILPHRTSFTVTSLGKIDSSTGQRGTTVSPINTTGADAAAKSVINVTGITDSENPQICYVAVLPGVLLADLNIDTGSEMGGFSPNFIKGKTINDQPVDPATYAVKNNYIYSLPDGSLHEYVKVEMTVNKVKKTYKWATMNVGATSTTDAGLYFMWGETTGQAAATGGENAFDPGFSWATYISRTGFASAEYATSPVEKKKVFKKYVLQSKANEYGYENHYDDKTTLDLQDDAAFANWGGCWRMPNGNEFEALAALDPDGDNFTPEEGWTVPDIGSKLFFPVSGNGSGKNLSSGNQYADVWASSCNSFTPSCAEFFECAHDETWVSGAYDRCLGLSVRAISE